MLEVDLKRVKRFVTEVTNKSQTPLPSSRQISITSTTRQHFQGQQGRKFLKKDGTVGGWRFPQGVSLSPMLTLEREPPRLLLSTPLYLTEVIIMPLWETNSGMRTAEVSPGCFLGISAAQRHLKMSFHSPCGSILSPWSGNHLIWVFYHQNSGYEDRASPLSNFPIK